ncbi:MAG TPA: hypothetical protein PKY46_01275 [Ignavibacteriaceae bacterium]|nr:hypothetical protein [Ignavibacteriaceae bacterium]
MRRNFIVMCVLSLFLFNQNVTGQSLGLNLSFAFPQGDFKENLDTFGWGGALEGLLPLHPVVSAGLNVGFYNYGNETRNEPWSMTIPDVTLEVTRSNNIANFHLFLRLAPPNMTFKPYLDLLAGGSYLYTETSVYSEKGVYQNNEEIASTNTIDDFAWSYGVGAGFMFKVMDLPSQQEGMDAELYIDLKARHLWGTEAAYLREGDVTIANGKVYFKPRQSKTDLLTIHLGAVVLF